MRLNGGTIMNSLLRRKKVSILMLGILAAALLTVLPELLRTFADYRMLVYAIVLILVMLITNNPMLRSLFSQLGRRRGREAQTQVGGADE